MDRLSDLPMFFRQTKRTDDPLRLRDAEACDIGNVDHARIGDEPVRFSSSDNFIGQWLARFNEHRKRLNVQAVTIAHRTRRFDRVFAEPLAHRRAVGVFVPPLQRWEHALPSFARRGAEAFEVRSGGAVEKNLAKFGGKIADARGGCDIEESQKPARVFVEPDAGFPPRLDRAFGDWFGVVGNDEQLVELRFGAKPVALSAGAVGRVEGKKPRLKLFDRALRMRRAGKTIGEEMVGPGGFARTPLPCPLPWGEGGSLLRHDHHAVAEFERGFDGVRESLADVRLEDDSIDHGFDGVSFVATEVERVVAAFFERFAEIEDIAVDTGTGEALALESLKRVRVESFFPFDDWREDEQANAVAKLQRCIDDLRCGGRGDRLAAARGHLSCFGRAFGIPTRRRTTAGVEQAEIVVNLRAGGDGGSRVVTA